MCLQPLNLLMNEWMNGKTFPPFIVATQNRFILFPWPSPLMANFRQINLYMLLDHGSLSSNKTANHVFHENACHLVYFKSHNPICIYNVYQSLI